MIKIGIRNNLLYPLMSIIFFYLRKIESIAMDKMTGFNGSLLLTLIMFFAEIISGFSFYMYEKNAIFNRKRSKSKFMGIKLIEAPDELKSPDSQLKIYLFIFVIAFVDFIEFFIDTVYAPKFTNVSSTLIIRLRTILTLFSGIISYFLLKIPIYKHQKFSLLMIFFSSIGVIIAEYIYIDAKKQFSFELFLIFINYFFDSFFDIIEKYLLEYNFMNPFQLVFIEGSFGFIITCIYSIVDNPFKEIKIFFKDQKTYKFILLIIFLVIYFFLCAGRNIYRVITNKMYFPISRSLTDSILDPLLIIYYFIWENDFKDKTENKNLVFFLINLFFSTYYVFFGCVYNEVLVLLCCKLGHNTHYQVSRRASLTRMLEDEMIEMPNALNESEEIYFKG